MLSVTINAEKNGIEIRFEEKPESSVLEELKANGFRWSKSQKMWYAKQTDDRLAMVEKLKGTEIEAPTETPAYEYGLWNLTRTDKIENNYAKYHIYDTKEIAKIVRDHIKSRFSMCSFSVRSDYHSITLHLKAAPWAKDSDEVNAIVHYVYRFMQSYNYDNSDIMTDYFDTNFYGTHESGIIDYDFKQREETVAEKRIAEQFKADKAAWEAAEKIRLAEDLKRREEEYKVEKERAAKIADEHKKKHAIIEAAAKVVDVDYYLVNCLEPESRKENRIDDYLDEDKEKWNRITARVTREVCFSNLAYGMFVNQLNDDYSFLANMGGSSTDDRRINSMTDYEAMSKEERETVEWYSDNCVAVVADGKIKCVIDPQGYNYARYVFFIDDQTERKEQYHTEYGISAEKGAQDKKYAEQLVESSERIRQETENAEEYKQAMKKWIIASGFPFGVDVIRALKAGEFKTDMYKLLAEYNSLPEQFERAALKLDQKITIFRISDFGGMATTKAYFKAFQSGKYAQYDKAVKLTIRPQNKRTDHYMWLHSDVLIYNGWVDLPESVLWEKIESGCFIAKKSKFLSCDKKQYEAIISYMDQQGVQPIINAVRP